METVEARRPIKARDTRWAATIARKVAERGIKPNPISMFSVVCAMASGACLVAVPHVSTGWAIVLFVGAALGIQCRLLCNLFDGMVAIEGGFKTKSGEIFNDMPDRLADPVILVCSGYAVTVCPWAHELGWLAGLLAVLTAYVRVLGVSAGTEQLFWGPMAKQHRMALMTVAFVASAVCVKFGYHEHVVMTALTLVCIGCIVTVIRRAAGVVRKLESQ